MRLANIGEHRRHLWETGEFLLVFVNGEDVTARCFAADDVEGWADCYAVDAAGRKHRVSGTQRAAQERLVGRVEFRPRP